MKTKNLIIILCLFAGLGLAIGLGCGSSGGGGGTTNTLANAPAGYSFTDENGNTITTITAGQTVQLRDANGNVLFAFTTDGNVDLSNVTAGGSDTDTKAFVHFPAATDKAGITGTVTLSIPCVSNQNSIVVCPDATTLAEVTAGCANAATLSPATTTAGNYTYANAVTRTGTTACQVTADIANFGTGSVGNVTLPTLTADDLLTVEPCDAADPQALLTDATFLADLAAVQLSTGYQMYYDAGAVCGRGAEFAGGHTEIFYIVDDPPLDDCQFNASLYSATAAGACGDTPGVPSIPQAGTYRHDFIAENEGRTYIYRIRATVTAGSPDVTGQSYNDVFGTEDISALVEYVDPAGSLITQDCTIQAVADSYLPYPMQTFIVREIASGNTLFTVQVEMICAELQP